MPCSYFRCHFRTLYIYGRQIFSLSVVVERPQPARHDISSEYRPEFLFHSTLIISSCWDCLEFGIATNNGPDFYAENRRLVRLKREKETRPNVVFFPIRFLDVNVALPIVECRIEPHIHTHTHCWVFYGALIRFECFQFEIFISFRWFASNLLSLESLYSASMLCDESMTGFIGQGKRMNAVRHKRWPIYRWVDGSLSLCFARCHACTQTQSLELSLISIR